MKRLLITLVVLFLIVPVLSIGEDWDTFRNREDRAINRLYDRLERQEVEWKIEKQQREIDQIKSYQRRLEDERRQEELLNRAGVRD